VSFDDAWFAGFTDGEGSFGVYPSMRPVGGFVPRFAVQLRADDWKILESLQSQFGGTLRRCPQARSRPKAMWRVMAKADLIALVEYFDRFPLRAKKASDYVIWRDAVVAYVEGGASDPRLAALASTLRDGRAYLEAVA
jgi:hypothetical protein